MKPSLRILAFSILYTLMTPVLATTCQTDFATVKQVFQWDDGSIFVVLDRPVGCSCPENYRAGFHKNDNEKFFLASALTAVATGKKVLVRADNVNNSCPIHNNTARLTAIIISN